MPAAPAHDPDIADPAFQIPVELINGPVLTICGGHDIVWESCTASAAIQNRLTAHHDRVTHTELRYPDAGHSVGSAFCYVSTTPDGVLRFGGTVLADAQASARARRAVFSFLSVLATST